MIRNRTLAALVATAMAFPAAAWAADLNVEIKGINIDAGVIRIALFREEGWSGEASVDGAEVAVDGATARVAFSGLSEGRYGIKLYQDVNGNGALDTNVIGIPKEPYAFSNDAPARFGPPKFEAAAFDVPEGESTHTITMK